MGAMGRRRRAACQGGGQGDQQRQQSLATFAERRERREGWHVRARCWRGLFVLLHGRCVAYDVPAGEEYPELSEGAVLREISLLELCPATAIVRAS